MKKKESLFDKGPDISNGTHGAIRVGKKSLALRNSSTGDETLVTLLDAEQVEKLLDIIFSRD